MIAVRRRTFLERLGLGAGATLLSPIASKLVRQARGATAPARKRVVFFLGCNGMSRWIVTPPDIKVATTALMDGVTSYTWPDMLKPLEKYRSRMLILDGFSNRCSAEHSAGYGALSALNVARGDGANDGSPAGITIDQHIAGKIGKTTVFKSLLWGVASGNPASQAKVFAAGLEQPLPHLCTPDGLYKKLFSTAGAAGYSDAAKRRRLLMDPLRADVKRLYGALAATERRTLDHYTSALEELDARLTTVQPAVCPAPGMPAAAMTLEDRLTTMNEMSILAVTCGLTNVVGISAGCGNAHSSPMFDRLQVGTRFESEGKLDYWGHEPKNYTTATTIINAFYAGLCARMADAWSKLPEGGGTVFDQTTIVFMNDSGGTDQFSHHRAPAYPWPLVVIGNAGGALKSNGRFLRWAADSRALGDFYSTIATAAGAPTTDFGKGGFTPVQGPLPELLA